MPTAPHVLPDYAAYAVSMVPTNPTRTAALPSASCDIVQTPVLRNNATGTRYRLPEEPASAALRYMPQQAEP